MSSPTAKELYETNPPKGMCHYKCGRHATTKDHIVAKSLLRQAKNIPMALHQANLVDCCAICNFYKSWYRSDCRCTKCLTAWEMMAPYILPRLKKDIPVRNIIGVLIGDMADELNEGRTG